MRSVAVAFTAGIMLTLSTQVALAAQTGSALNDYGPYAGWSYNNQAVLWNNPMQAGVRVRTAQGYDAPPGYFGGRPRMLNSDGTICRVSSFAYNNSAAHDITWYGNTGGCAGYSSWYSQGWSQAWNGYSYETFGTWKSPSLSN